jgi:histidinol-phosphate phosphatase family protein
MRAVFLDRDATIVYGIPKYNHVDNIDKVELLPKSLEAMRLLASLDYGVFLVTNQAGMAKGLISPTDFQNINNKVLDLIEPSGIKIIKTYVCPHAVDGGCECRKPKPKLLLDAAQEYNIDLNFSYIVGDRVSDVQTGINAGAKTILVKTGDPNVESGQATYTAPTLLEAVEYISVASSAEKPN